VAVNTKPQRTGAAGISPVLVLLMCGFLLASSSELKVLLEDTNEKVRESATMALTGVA
jgi:hypothetical protein